MIDKTTKETCFMKKNDGCRALKNMPPNCGPRCGFFKTLEQQQAIEETCKKRAKRLKFDYKSCIRKESK